MLSLTGGAEEAGLVVVFLASVTGALALAAALAVVPAVVVVARTGARVVLGAAGFVSFGAAGFVVSLGAAGLD